MSIAAAAKHTPLPPLRSIGSALSTVPSLDFTGKPTSSPRQAEDLAAEGALERLRGYVNGGGRIFACMATGTNVITLTPNGHGDEDGVSPLLEGYRFGDAFAFWAEITSTGAVTATVVPKSGSLSTIKVYRTNGSAQAGSGDVVANSFYVAWYVPILDSNAGGLVLK